MAAGLNVAFPIKGGAIAFHDFLALFGGLYDERAGSFAESAVAVHDQVPAESAADGPRLHLARLDSRDDHDQATVVAGQGIAGGSAGLRGKLAPLG